MAHDSMTKFIINNLKTFYVAVEQNANFAKQKERGAYVNFLKPKQRSIETNEYAVSLALDIMHDGDPDAQAIADVTFDVKEYFKTNRPEYKIHMFVATRQIEDSVTHTTYDIENAIDVIVSFFQDYITPDEEWADRTPEQRGETTSEGLKKYTLLFEEFISESVNYPTDLDIANGYERLKSIFKQVKDNFIKDRTVDVVIDEPGIHGESAFITIRKRLIGEASPLAKVTIFPEYDGTNGFEAIPNITTDTEDINYDDIWSGSSYVNGLCDYIKEFIYSAQKRFDNYGLET
jgi:hypothetical protein